jgi:hypothetical protein
MGLGRLEGGRVKNENRKLMIVLLQAWPSVIDEFVAYKKGEAT